MATEQQTPQAGDGGVATVGPDTLTITDNRTGRTYEVEVNDGTVKAMDLRQIKVSDDDFGLMSYDPAFTNTASCRSAITFIDGEAGILEHRGYPIEQLCEHSSYLEVAYLLVFGELPTQAQLERWKFDVTHHTFVHEDIKQFLQGFRYDAHPMGMLLAGVGALSTFYPDAKHIDDPEERYMAAIRMIAKVPTLAAFAYRHNMGLPYVYPDNDLSYPGNFLSMMFKKTEATYEPDPRLERALDVLFILHADHEQNCSTNAVRGVGSSQVDPYSAVAAGVAALYGPLHGGANESVLRMLRRIETVENVPDFLEGVKNREERLMGFGHRVYKNYDPRARIIQQHMDEVFEATEYNPLVEVARELEKRALDDDYFTSRKLYPNVDYYSGIIYEALQIPTEMFTVIFAIPRTSGWVVAVDGAERRSRAEDRPPAAGLHRGTGSRLPPDRAARGPREDRRPAGSPPEAPAPRRVTRLREGRAGRLPADDQAWLRREARGLREPRRGHLGARGRRPGDPRRGAAGGGQHAARLRPGDRVHARFELSTGGLIRGREAGIDVMGDGTLVPYVGVDPQAQARARDGETAFEAVREALRVSATRPRSRREASPSVAACACPAAPSRRSSSTSTGSSRPRAPTTSSGAARSSSAARSSRSRSAGCAGWRCCSGCSAPTAGTRRWTSSTASAAR